MKLSQKALAEIKANKRLRNRLALELDKTSKTILLWIDQNSDNLTKATALKIVREETGLDDSQILDEVSQAA